MDVPHRLYHKEDILRGSREETGANGLKERYMHIQQQTKGNQEMGRGLTVTGGEGRSLFFSKQSKAMLRTRTKKPYFPREGFST